VPGRALVEEVSRGRALSVNDAREPSEAEDIMGQVAPDEIVLAETEPETEWILGAALQKVSPRRTHAVVQLAAARILSEWARGNGQVGTEWRFRLAPQGEVRRPLVPDVSYVSYERLRELSPEDRELPPIGPEIAIEVRSPDNHAGYLRHKRSVYFATGTYVVIVIDPAQRTVTVADVDGAHAVFAGDDDAIASRYPELRFPLGALFAELDIPE